VDGWLIKSKQAKEETIMRKPLLLAVIVTVGRDPARHDDHRCGAI
jgi:hypothetical protein